MKTHANMFARWYIILLVFITSGGKLHAQHFQMVNYTVEDGLPSSEVYCMLQDRQGYLWFGTDRGAVRYDGYRFQTFTTDNGLPDNTVFEMHEDSLGRIWFGTYSPLLFYYQEGHIYPYAFNAKIEAAELPPGAKTSLHIDRSGTIRIGTTNIGLVSIDLSGNLTFSGVKGNALIFNKEGQYLLAILRENALLPKAKQITIPSMGQAGLRIEVLPGKWLYEEVQNSSSKYLCSTVTAENGQLYLGLGKSLHRYADGVKLAEYPLPHPISFMYVLENRLWIGYLHGGLQVMDLTSHQILPMRFPQLEGKTVSSVLSDREGGYWISTTQQGLFYVPSLSFRYLPFTKKNANQTIDDLQCINDSVAFISLGSKRLLKMSTSVNMPWEIQTVLPLSQVTKLLWKASASELLVVGHEVLVLHDQKPVKQLLGKITQGVKSITQRRDGSIWSGSRGGLNTIRNGQIEKVYKDEVNFEIWDLMEDHQGNLWLGTLNGLRKLDKNGQLHPRYSHPGLRKRITALNQLPDGRLVVGTLGAGVLLVDGANVQQITSAEGLGTNLVNCLAVDHCGRIWVGSGKGLSRISFTEAGAPEVASLEPGNGLPFMEIQRLKTHGQNVWLAGPSGVAVLHLDDWPTAPPAPTTSLRWININGQDTLPLQEIELDYRHNYLNFGFIALHFRRKSPLNYRYRLLGLDHGWRYTQDTVVTYPALQPGDYTFEVAARNTSGHWSNSPAQSRIRILPPYWQLWWFFPALLLSLGLLVAGISTYFIRQSKAKWKRERNLEKWKMKALRARMDPHFTFNTLNTIQAYISTHETVAAEKYLNKFARLVRKVLHQSDAETISLADEREMLSLYLDLEQMRFEDQFDYKIEIDASLNAESVQIPGMLVQPFAENSILHGLLPKGGGGLLHIRFANGGHQIRCTIEDNGIGREKALQGKRASVHPHKSAGLALVRSRLQLLYPRQNIDDKIVIRDLLHPDQTPAGTLVEFYIPTQNL